MVTIKIGESERSLPDADVNWVNQQINRRRAEGLTVCVRVTIKTQAVNVILATPGCASSGGASRRLTEEEQRVFDLWQQRGLNQSDFSSGNVVAFIKQLDRVI